MAFEAEDCEILDFVMARIFVYMMNLHVFASFMANTAGAVGGKHDVSDQVVGDRDTSLLGRHGPQCGRRGLDRANWGFVPLPLRSHISTALSESHTLDQCGSSQRTWELRGLGCDTPRLSELR